MRLRRVVVQALAGCAVVALAGCASYRPEPIAPASTAAALDARTLADPRLNAFLDSMNAPRPQAPNAWSLERLTLAALFFHPDLDIAYAKLAVADAGVRTAHQRPNPTINLLPQYNATTTVPSPWTVGGAVNLVIETFGKRTYRTDQARYLAEAARDDIGTAAWQVRGRVRTAMLDLWAARQRVRLTAKRLAQEEQLVTLLEHRLAVGEASAVDVAREGINRDQAAVAVKDAEKVAATAQAQLATALGVPARALEGVELDLAVFDQVQGPADAMTGPLRQTALTGRADIRSALAQYSAAQSAVQLQIANQYPNLTLGPGYTWDQGDSKYSVPLTLDLPVFNQNQGPIAEALARRRLSAATFLGLQAQVMGAVDAAAVSYGRADQSLATAEAVLAAQRDRQARTEALFRAGQVDRPTLLAGALEVSAAEIARLDAVMAQRQALGQLEDALQHPLFGSGAVLPVLPASPRLDAEPAQ
ncbi:TolC family protein [Phenylobacterium montanum]|uniref:TolC family protein n=1 Tax=Phenylobacterium montanum TaxID=2823693 RepID=A0A975G4I9_9CAUL|nr:TolC family protein [Caulobacter sp. S6]QUD90988.1 TolC family protein [Caulobacter sp. S6]